MDKERYEYIKESLLCCIEAQVCDLKTVDTKELGEAIDMIKDMEEAIYYATITEAMHQKDYKYEDKDYNVSSGMTKEHETRHQYTERPMYLGMRDYREGKSPKMRKNYMELKEIHGDKNMQMKELESYIRELSDDLMEMIEDATVEEKQLLQKKLATLATKIV